MKCDVLILPGLWNSGPRHWQSLWHERNPHWRRAAHRDWTNPHCDEWVAELDAAIADCQGAPILVAHSLGCMLVAHWARCGSPLKVAGAFLAAPSDVEAASFPFDPGSWAPVPMEALPFPSLVVGSDNDSAASATRAIELARDWGSDVAILSGAGHINVKSGHQRWEQGFAYLYRLQSQIEKRERLSA